MKAGDIAYIRGLLGKNARAAEQRHQSAVRRVKEAEDEEGPLKEGNLYLAKKAERKAEDEMKKAKEAFDAFEWRAW